MKTAFVANGAAANGARASGSGASAGPRQRRGRRPHRAVAGRRRPGGPPACRPGGDRDRAGDARRPRGRLHDRRGAHEPTGRPPAPRRRAGHLHGDGLPRAPRRQREQRGGVFVPWHVQPAGPALPRAAPRQLVPPAGVHRRRHCRAGRSRPGVTGLHRGQRALLGGRVRAAGDPGGRPVAARGAAPGAARRRHAREGPGGSPAP